MGILHDLEAIAESPIIGMQAQQRDWSPYVAHFTSAKAMKPLKALLRAPMDPVQIRQALVQADTASFSNLCSILRSGVLRASLPPASLPQRPRVCLSECTLPGLISHAERFGRCGLVFEKSTVYQLGGRPCLYVSDDIYHELGARSRALAASAATERAFDLANIFRPRKTGLVQDFTHEREWRVPCDLPLSTTPLAGIIVPRPDDVGKLPASVAGTVPVIPLTLLHRWGV
jgi:hypothetical protein